MNENQLQVGDLLMKLRHGGVVHALISWGQRLHRAGNATDDYVHAAIYTGNGSIAESIGEGITVTRLMAQGHPYVYNVYRYANADIAGIAAAVAEGWITMRRGQHAGFTPRGSYGKYALGGAVKAAAQNIGSRPAYAPGEDLWGRDGQAGISSTYCSQFVVAAYHAAGATAQPTQVPIRIAQARATPKMLHDVLLGEPQWDMPGQITVR
jgi:hypothetical protein